MSSCIDFTSIPFFFFFFGSPVEFLLEFTANGFDFVVDLVMVFLDFDEQLVGVCLG